MLYQRFFMVGCILGMLLAGCQQQTPVPTPDILTGNAESFYVDTWSEGFKGEIEWSECTFETYDTQPSCGFLEVPLDYSQPTNGETVRLALARYPARSTTPKSDPFIGVFGYPLTEFSARFMTYIFEDINQERDLLIFDLRGFGLSTPALICPEMNTAMWDTLSVGWPLPEDLGKFNRQCRQSLESQQVDLDFYNLEAMANDVKALRLALGYTEWNLFVRDTLGGLVAYEQLRVDSDGVRSIVSDGIVPNNGDPRPRFEAAAKVLGEFFALCGQDTKCNDTFPDLEKTLAEDVELLNTKPMKVTAFGADGRQGEFMINGKFLTEMVLFDLFFPDRTLTGQLPRMIYQVKEGNPEVLAQLVSNYINSADFMYDHLFNMVACRQSPLIDEDILNAAITTAPSFLAETFDLWNQNDRAVCEVWSPLPTEIRPAPNAGSTPILVVTGSWNWVWSAESYLKDFTQSAAAAKIVTVPMAGGYNFFSTALMDCTTQMTSAFIASPEAQLDTACVPSEQKITWITMR